MHGRAGRDAHGAERRRPAARAARREQHGGESADDAYEAARARFDRIYFTNLLRRCGGSITEAAQRAGISRGHLHRRVRELGCDAEAARQAGRGGANPPGGGPE
ncbi:MAG: helix-turn-helix domain-containing protein [Planctomycetota bacterium]